MKPIVLRLKRKGPTEGYSVVAEGTEPPCRYHRLDCPDGIAFLTSDIATVLSGFDLLEKTEGLSDVVKHEDDYAVFLITNGRDAEGVMFITILDIVGGMQKCFAVSPLENNRVVADMISRNIAVRIDPLLSGMFIPGTLLGRPAYKINPDYVEPPVPRYYQP